MYDEKNRKEAAVITVASKKDTKERGNIMENKKKSFNFKKFKKDVQGITLIALVVTIVLNCCEAAMDRINRKSKIIEII